jgi:biopolymer transport protein ExbD
LLLGGAENEGRCNPLGVLGLYSPGHRVTLPRRRAKSPAHGRGAMPRLAGFRGGKYLLGLKAEINVAPFVDVMLVLLIIFTVSGPVATASIKIDQPPCDLVDPSYAARHVRPTYISVRSGGRIYLTGQETHLGSLNADLTRRLATSHENSRIVLIRADKHVRYGEFMAVVNQLQAHGYGVSLINEDLTGES